MLTVNAKCVNIVQGQAGSVQFRTEGNDKKPGTIIVVQFSDPKEAAKFIHGETYDISIKSKK